MTRVRKGVYTFYITIALGVTSGTLVFSEDERGPSDELKLQFEALNQFDDEERKVAKPCWKV